MNKKDLMNGIEFFFNNEDYQISIQNDDIRQATITYNWLLNCFIIWFNGKIIHSTKSFNSMKKRLEKLINDWNLTEGEL